MVAESLTCLVSSRVNKVIIVIITRLRTVTTYAFMCAMGMDGKMDMPRPDLCGITVTVCCSNCSTDAPCDRCKTIYYEGLNNAVVSMRGKYPDATPDEIAQRLGTYRDGTPIYPVTVIEPFWNAAYIQ